MCQQLLHFKLSSSISLSRGEDWLLETSSGSVEGLQLADIEDRVSLPAGRDVKLVGRG